MAFSDMQGAIAGELARSDLTTEIQREINNAITFYGNKAFWFNEATMADITTVQGQRYYPLPTNFASVLDVLATLGNYTYRLEPRTEQYLDQVDWGNDFWSGYPTDYSFWNGQIRLFPPPQGGLPVKVKGTVILSPAPLTQDSDTNAWLTSAEELIRTRAVRQLYGRYIRDPEQYMLYTQLEKEALANLQEKNIGQTGLNTIRPHL
ncbi:MAG TPA: hypothetical protein VF651_08385 [Gammaproteobacteria bacterium]